jgi:Protein of unknown function (DUF1566)
LLISNRALSFFIKNDGMKIKFLLPSCLFVLTGYLINAQAPQLINYQAVLRNSGGAVIQNSNALMRFTIQDSYPSDSVEYIETDSVTTNQFGIINVQIGGGTKVQGTFSTINWPGGNKFLNVEMKLPADTGFKQMGLTQLVSVPYAFYADSVGKNSYPVHNIGDHYGGGIVFWTDSLGQHGLIADTVDLDTGIVWNHGSYNLTNATRNGIGAGKANTERIIIKQGNGQYAAQLCADYQGGGYSDWYLPSVTELTLLYRQQAIVGNFTTGVYWSSSELSTQQATAISFTGGVFTPSNKTLTRTVRAIRAF